MVSGNGQLANSDNGIMCLKFRADFSGVGMTYKLILLQPAGEHLTILHVSIDKTGMTGMPEQMPSTVGNMFIERGCHNRRADIARATTDKCRLGNLTQSIRILKVLQAAERLIFIRSPAIEVGFCAGALRTTDAFWRVFIDTDDILLKVMIVGLQVGRIVPLACGFGPADCFLVFNRQIFDEPMLLTRPQPDSRSCIP